MSDGDHFLETTPRPAPSFERLKDYLRELSERAGAKVWVRLTLDAAAWRAFRAEHMRPGHARASEMTFSEGGWVLTVTQAGEEPTP